MTVVVCHWQKWMDTPDGILYLKPEVVLLFKAMNLRDKDQVTICRLCARRTLTWDQGSEMAAHEFIAAMTGLSICFCDAGSPWQRGSNENLNGLLRQYFCKGTDLSVHDASELKRVQDEVNDRPRKLHGWKSPNQVMQSLLASAETPCRCDDR